jgi:hypothetical protein
VQPALVGDGLGVATKLAGTKHVVCGSKASRARQQMPGLVGQQQMRASCKAHHGRNKLCALTRRGPQAPPS